MSFFVKSTAPVPPKTNNVKIISIAFAVVLVVMAVAQLFTFEKFPDVLRSLWLPTGDSSAHILAALIVALEVLAIPFLLSMRLSPAMRTLSMVFGWLVVSIWLMIMLWENLTVNAVANCGLLGATVALPVGWWSVLVCAALGVLAAWAAWGMWPFPRSQAK